MNDTYEKPEAKPRTALQNSSLHGTLREYADRLNGAGYSYFVFLEHAKKKGFEVDWTEEALKNLFRTVTEAMFNVKSTKDLSTAQIKQAYDVFERHMSELSGVGCRWHSKEEQLNQSQGWW